MLQFNVFYNGRPLQNGALKQILLHLTNIDFDRYCVNLLGMRLSADLKGGTLTWKGLVAHARVVEGDSIVTHEEAHDRCAAHPLCKKHQRANESQIS